MPDAGNETATIKELHATLTPHVIRAGVGKKAWERIIYRIESRSDTRQLFVRTFLISLRDNEWKAIDVTWNLPNATEEMWDNMLNLYADETFPEVTRLRRDQRRLRERWVTWKEEYKRFIAKDKSTDGPEEAEE